ncbi:hypothetical protein AB1Y20_018357 [Prymnesium parvum]|uniref:Post-GPI attachment to proteins factor 3 n=1 Tax=Prymnesium parvum TaxID=97485 RepID=A0AB34JRF5_PRYPA
MPARLLVPQLLGFIALLAAAVQFYTDREHGSKHCKVPLSWRAHRGLLSLYSLSSLMFCLTGAYILLLCHAYPQRSLYTQQYVEGLLWIWSGCISYACDAVDLGVKSWSHPIDRLSATLFIAYNVLAYVAYARMGALPVAATIEFPLSLMSGLFCFKRSGDAVHKGDMEGYFFWHTAWHFVLPITGILHFSLIYFI